MSCRARTLGEAPQKPRRYPPSTAAARGMVPLSEELQIMELEYFPTAD